jgi:ribosome maturation factor RimP
MMSEKIKQQVIELVREPLGQLECELADLTLSHYKSNWVLRLFVYASGGVTIDLCAQVSRVVGEVIDGTDLFADGYTLEVSSPGLDRPLTTELDFRYRVGEEVRVVFLDRDRVKIQARIVGFADGLVEFDSEGDMIKIPLTEIEKAEIII